MSNLTMGERLAALSPALYARIDETLESDAGFRAAFLADPRAAYHTRFGEDLLPGEQIEMVPLGEEGYALTVRALGFAMSLDREGRVCVLDELPDEMLEMSSGGTNAGSFVGPMKQGAV